MRNNVLYHIMIFFVACCFIFSLPTLSHANKIPEFRTNLGGLPISCSIYSDQATINNVKSSYRLKDVYAVLGKPSSEYKREGITYVNYEGLYFTFADYSGDGNLYIRSITTAHKSGATTIDGVKPGMSEDVLTKVYGTADSIHTVIDTAPKLSAADNKKRQDRINKTIYTYNANECVSLCFTVKNGVISEIAIYVAE